METPPNQENFDKFTTMLLNFAAESPEDAYRYAVISTTPTLLLIASLNANREKLESIANKIKELTDELELYTLTFIVALEENEEENKAAITAGSPEELRRTLESVRRQATNSSIMKSQSASRDPSSRSARR
jgi:hypothetical protein